MGVWGTGPLENDMALNYLGGVKSTKDFISKAQKLIKDYSFTGSYAFVGLLVDSYNQPKHTIDSKKAAKILKGDLIDENGEMIITESSRAWLFTCSIPVNERNKYLANAGKRLYYHYKHDSFSDWVNPSEIRSNIDVVLNDAAEIIKSEYKNPIIMPDSVVKALNEYDENELIKDIKSYNDKSIVFESITKKGVEAYSIYSNNIYGGYTFGKREAVLLLQHNKVLKDNTGLAEKFNIKLDSAIATIHCTVREDYPKTKYNDKYSLYYLVGSNGNTLATQIDSDKLKDMIRQGYIKVDNLTLTKDNRLIESKKGTIKIVQMTD